MRNNIKTIEPIITIQKPDKINNENLKKEEQNETDKFND